MKNIKYNMESRKSFIITPILQIKVTGARDSFKILMANSRALSRHWSLHLSSVQFAPLAYRLGLMTGCRFQDYCEISVKLI